MSSHGIPLPGSKKTRSFAFFILAVVLGAVVFLVLRKHTHTHERMRYTSLVPICIPERFLAWSYVSNILIGRQGLKYGYRTFGRSEETLRNALDGLKSLAIFHIFFSYERRYENRIT